MEAKNSQTRRCGFSPFQIAIGRDPELPGDLLQDLLNVISSSSILHDDVAAQQPVFDPMRDLQCEKTNLSHDGQMTDGALFSDAT